MEKSEHYDDLVVLKYKLYNSLFLTLPFNQLGDYGQSLPLFAKHCDQMIRQGENPLVVVDHFFSKVLGVEQQVQMVEILFLYLQLMERQVLLFDAVEKAADRDLLRDKILQRLNTLKHQLPQGKTVRLVLTAHPTQFYPEALLGLIDDITQAVADNDIEKVRLLLLQLGQTSFKNVHPPTPLDEAEMLIEHFGGIFFETFLKLKKMLPDKKLGLELGFWPGGDRDGNPFVTKEVTQAVAAKLKKFCLQQYIKRVESLKKRVTFKRVLPKMSTILEKLRKGEYQEPLSLRQDVIDILAIVDRDYQGLFRESLLELLLAIDLFGFYFASLDLRENSLVIREVMQQLIGDEDPAQAVRPASVNHDLVQLLTIVPRMQKQNGEKGVHRFIVSHTESSCDLFNIFYLSMWFAQSALDIVPLFETIEAMEKAPKILSELLSHEPYWNHLHKRGAVQTVMLGFSDGTKDGGYLTCNLKIQKCKEELQRIAKTFEVSLIFFDGRGGPPARGGGLTHKYYAMVAERMPQDTIELTIQGQSISSQFGSNTLALFYIVELLTAFTTKPQEVDDSLLEDLSQKSQHAYQLLKDDDRFIALLLEATPLSLLGELNIASRPPKREGVCSLDSLRAISFVGAWSLMKLNVPAFYGFGTALEELKQQGQLGALKQLYKESKFFQVLVGNSVQALRKSFPQLTLYTEQDSKFGALWTILRKECEKTQSLLLELQEKPCLGLENPISEQSVTQRETIILPLLVIQHYALQKWRAYPEQEVWKKMLLKSIPPSINASRNSA